MADRAKYDACDFTGSTTLAPVGGSEYYLPCTTPGATMYISCSVGSHCQMGQKVTVNVSSAVYAVDHTTGDALIHVNSLARVATLMGAAPAPNAPDTTLLQYGYATEAEANTTLEFVWCLEAHCPASARTYDPSATLATCKADVYNLGGYISRKMPNPKLALAGQYYQQALAEEPGHCPTLEYYTELHLMTNDATQAAATATELCSRCGASSGYATLARLAFASASGFTTGDFDAACAEATPASSPPPPEDSAASSLRGPGLSSRLGAVLMMVSVGVMCVKMAE